MQFTNVSGLYTYDDLARVEKSDTYQTQVGMDQSAVLPPRLYFGCMPVQSNAPLASVAAFSPAVVQWYIETEMHVTLPLQPITQNAYGYFPLTAWDPMTFNDAGFNDLPSLRWHGKGMQIIVEAPPPHVQMETEQDNDNRSDTLSRVSSIRRRLQTTI